MNKGIGLIAALALASFSFAEEAPTQDRESMAMDSTASQWSFQGAYQTMPNYHDDIVNGAPRPAGLDNYAQFRVVAPVPLKKMTILPRLTIRHYEAPNGDSGFGNTELFGLVIPKPWDWGTGRVGIGPLVTAPGDSSVARDEWGYGFAAAAVNTQGKWFYGLLFTQTWRAINPALQQPEDPTEDTNPLGIAPFLAYRIADGWYVQTADLVAQYDWNNNEFYMPIGVRFGKVIVSESSSWNLYAEYVTSLFYDNWSGSAVKDSFRLNVSYTIPVSL